ERADLEVSEIWVALGRLHYNARRLEDARAAYDEALEIRRRRVESSPDQLVWRERLAAAYFRAGEPDVLTGDLDRAIASYQSALQIDAELTRLAPHNRDHAHSLMGDHSNLAEVYSVAKEYPRALEHLGSAIQIGERLVEADPLDVRALRSIGILAGQHADLLLDLGRFEEGMASASRALNVRKQLAASDPEDARARREVGVSHFFIAAAWLERAEDLTEPAARREAYRNAEPSLQSSRALFLAMQDDGSLQGRDAGVLDDIREMLAAVAQGLGTDRP
ncbi:MAG: tetratricopeptide repeat protein, partial [Acidobacteriota bacterium]